MSKPHSKFDKANPRRGAASTCTRTLGKKLGFILFQRNDSLIRVMGV